jgi:DNA repair protein RadC
MNDIISTDSTTQTTIATATPHQLNFVREITVQYRGPRLRPPQIRDALDAKRFLDKVLKDNAREHFFALYLDASHRTVSYSVVSSGTANSCQVHPREVFQPAILTGACAIIIAHNHPSGELHPSEEDRNVTRRLTDCGALFGIKVLDHIIFSDRGHVSFVELGLMPNIVR